MAGISRVCIGASNTPDTFRYAHFLPLMRRTISLRISWVLEVPSVVVEENIAWKHGIEESTVKGKEYALFRSLQLYPWVLPVFHYQDTVELLTSLKEYVIDPAELKAQELARQK